MYKKSSGGGIASNSTISCNAKIIDESRVSFRQMLWQNDEEPDNGWNDVDSNTDIVK